jgi:hypothetical protein
MPGSGRCARCGASLALASATINVHPPRAGRFSRLSPVLWRLWHSAGRIGAMVTPAIRAFASRSDDAHFDGATIRRGIVPGWPQLHGGRRTRGLAYLVGYLCLMLPGLLLTGTSLGAVLLGLAVAVHIVATCDAVVGNFAAPSERIAFTIVCGLFLCGVVYFPIGWLVSRVATPIRIEYTIPPFERGDVVWYNRWETPSKGDMVIYTLAPLATAGRTANGYAAQFRFQGDWIGRLIAKSGQTVAVDNGHWIVDGVSGPLQSGEGVAIAASASWVVPENHAVIVPDGLVQRGARVDLSTLQQLYLVPKSQIFGRVYFRSLPFTRMGVVE